MGTHFLLADEAGTKHTHKIALKELRGRPTTLTKAFTGRSARAITNTFTEKYSQSAPSMYPELHHLTSELRANANYAGDVESLNLWAGVNYGCAHSAPAADIVDELTPYSTSLGVGRVVPLAAQVAVVGGGREGWRSSKEPWTGWRTVMIEKKHPYWSGLMIHPSDPARCGILIGLLLSS